MTWGRFRWGWSLGVLFVMAALQPVSSPAEIIKGHDGVEMVLVPAGEVWMGSTPAEVNQAVEAARRRA